MSHWKWRDLDFKDKSAVALFVGYPFGKVIQDNYETANQNLSILNTFMFYGTFQPKKGVLPGKITYPKIRVFPKNRVMLANPVFTTYGLC